MLDSTLQNYKGSQETTSLWATWKKWTILKKRYNLPRLNQDKTENMN